MKNYTDLTLLIDRSGSMSNIAKEMEQGFKTFLEKEKASGDDTKVSVVYFDNDYLVDFVEKDIKDVHGISIIPRGWTALIDSFHRLIQETGERLSNKSEEERPNRVLFYIITDGQDNQSKEVTIEKLQEACRHQREKYAWDFVFLGANIDSFSTGANLGIARSSTRNYVATPAGVIDLWEATSTSFGQYKSLDRNADRISTYSFDNIKDDNLAAKV